MPNSTVPCLLQTILTMLILTQTEPLTQGTVSTHSTTLNSSNINIIQISYQELINQTPEAIESAKQAFCTRSSYGALKIIDIPHCKSYRDGVMNWGRQLALDPGKDGIRMRKECRGDLRVGPGWMGTPGKETHSLQSGFYANMKNHIDGVQGGDGDGGHANVWGANRWPRTKDKTDASSTDSEATFEECITSAAELMYSVTLWTLDLAHKAAVEVLHSHLHLHSPSQNKSVVGKNVSTFLPDLRQMAEQSEFLPARLVYYDANFSREDKIMKDDNRQYWLPWHVDFNLATAFAPAMWIDEVAALNGKEENSHSRAGYRDCNLEHDAGLLLRNPEGTIIPAALGDDCILVQLGAHSQLATGGLLKAGPHAVGKSEACIEKDVSTRSGRVKFGRLSFGLFVYGPWAARMKPSDDLLELVGGEKNADVSKDDFGCLMEKAYTGDTVLEGYKKFESYMNGL